MIKSSDFKLNHFYLISEKGKIYEGKCIDIYSPFIDLQVLKYNEYLGCNEFGTYQFY